jgi:hypothetical protein
MLLSVICLTTRESLVFAVSTVVLFFYVGFNTPQPDYETWGGSSVTARCGFATFQRSLWCSAGRMKESSHTCSACSTGMVVRIRKRSRVSDHR